MVHGTDVEQVGRLDPKNGAFKEYRTKTPNSGPHGLVADADGNIWFTANFAGYIGKLDPKTGAIIEYRLPDDARDPHTPVFDQMGSLWFTVQGADMIGRLVPKTGEIKLVPVPTANALPYGIAVNSEGVPYFAEFGSNKLASIDPKTMEIMNIHCPTPAAGRGASPSRMMMRSGTPIIRAADLGPVRSKRRLAFARGLHQAARIPALTGSLRSVTSSGIANPPCTRTHPTGP